MIDLEEFYKKTDGNAKDVIDRLGGNADILKMFLAKFSSDPSLNELKIALDANDVDNAFRAAHTLKGVCANLGIQNLYKLSFNITELLRNKSLEEAKLEFPKLEKSYNEVLDLLKL